MKRIVWILAVLTMIISGCSGIEWFPEEKKSDTSPDSFQFTAKTNVTPGSTVTSDAITVTGIPSGSAPISVSGDASSEYSINGGTPTSTAGTVKNDDTVTVQHTASSDLGATVTTTLTIGDKSADFTSTTVRVTIDPAFASLTNQTINTIVQSNSVVVTGVDPPFVINISGGEFNVNGTGFTSLQGSAQDGDTITLRHTTASTPSTAVTTTVTIGGVPFTFTSTTAGL